MSSSSQVSSEIKPRPTGIYHPSVWNDYFLSIDSDALELDDAMVKQAESLKVEVRNMLITAASATQNPLLEKLILVDSILRLGVSYHFENEINQVLELIYQAHQKSISDDIATDHEDFHGVTLRFRLLRQAGYNISSDVFTMYTDKEGKFEESLANDLRKLLSLYEAAHMRVHGEDILDKALEFATNHLKEAIAAVEKNSLSEPLVTEVRDALNQPLRKCLPRMKARQYMLIYEQDPSHNNDLLSFAKIDFNMLQKMHQKELNHITRWWKKLDFARNLPYARDRIVECYFWILGVYFEPCFDVARTILTKVIAMASVLDDTYDAYGTFEELQLFTTAIKRWDRGMIHQLPDYMKILYTTLLDLYEEFETEIAKDGRSYHFHFAKQAMIKQVVAYFEEAEWLHKSYKPTFEEYMKVALVSTGYPLLVTTSLLGMGDDIVTNDIFEWVAKTPKIIEAATVISRLMDDVVSYKFEKEREHITSAVECYAEQYGVSEKTTCIIFRKQVMNKWKDLNEAFLESAEVPMAVMMCILNLSRVMDLLYSDEDGYTNSNGRTKQLIKSMLVEPVTF